MSASEERATSATEEDSASLNMSRGDTHLIVAGLTIELGLIAFWLLSDVWRGSSWLIPGFLLPTFLFFAFIFYLFRMLSRNPSTVHTRWIILGFAALFHISMLLTSQPLSNDLYRYLWDGKILASGINPYTYTPADDALVAFRDSNWELIFNRDISTGYPPVTELLFAFNHLLNLGGFGLRMLSVACSLGICIVIMEILGHLGEDERRAIVYAWSPLVAVEFGNSGHFDAIAILALTLAFLFHIKHNKIGSAIFLAVGGLVKFFPALLAPIWGRRWGFKSWSVFVFISCLPWVPFISGGSPFTGLGVFASRGDFNASVSGIVQSIWGVLLLPSNARLATRITSVLIVILVALIILRKIWRSMDIATDWTFAFLMMGWILLVSPVVHPWYLCWMLAFIAIEWELAWLILSGSVIFARHVYLGLETNGIWRESMWVRWAVYLPFYLTWFIQQVKGASRIRTRNLFPLNPDFIEGEAK